MKFLTIAASTPIKTNLNMINATVTSLEKSLGGLMTPGQTEELQSAVNILTPLVQQLVSFSKQVTGALTNLVLDPTTPIDVLFEQFDNVVQGISKYVADERTNVINSIKKSMGCVRAQPFEKSSVAFEKLLEIANIVTRIGEIVLKPDELRHSRQSQASKVDPTQLKNLVGALAKGIIDLNEGLTALVTVVKNTVSAIEMSNSFLKGLISKKDTVKRGVFDQRGDIDH